MDKPRWGITWCITVTAVCWTYNDSFWWTVVKLAPFAIACAVIEQYRSYRQNNP